MKLKEVPHKFAQIECQRAKTKRTWLLHSFCRFRSSVDISSCGKKGNKSEGCLMLAYKQQPLSPSQILFVQCTGGHANK